MIKAQPLKRPVSIGDVRLEKPKRPELGGIKLPPFIPGGELRERLHDTQVARGLKNTIRLQLSKVRLGEPLPKSEAPHRGKDGRMYAPNGNPLIEVKLSQQSYGTAETTSSRTAYVDPKTNQYYVVDAHGTIGPTQTRAFGPFKLPPGSRFVDQEFSKAELKHLEDVANHPRKFPIPRCPPIRTPPFFPTR